MQTFLPYSDFSKTAMCLDYRRLNKQRIEAMQIYFALRKKKYGWKNHPAVKMWKGYEAALCLYGATMCMEWIRRGYNDNKKLFVFFSKALIVEQANQGKESNPTIQYPKWLGNKNFHRSHQSNLLRKDAEYYGQFFRNVSADLPYVWPVKTESISG